MSKGTYSIELSDGTQLIGLELNGNNFISKARITEDTFSGKLSHVIITGNVDDDDDNYGLIGEHFNMELVQVKQHGNEYWFILRDMTAEELQRLQNRADIDYLAMMTGVTL